MRKRLLSSKLLTVLLTIAALATGLTAHATITKPITFQGRSQTSGNQTMGAGVVSSPWGTMNTPVQSGSSYTFNNVVMRGDATVTLNGTLDYQESTSLTDVVTTTWFTVTIESSSSTHPLWFYTATVKTGSDGAVSDCITEVSSDRKTLTVTIPADKTFGKIVLSYATHEPISSSNTVISGVESEYIYYGSPIKPVPTVTYYNTVLTEGTDYTYYINGGDGVGNATVFVNGAGEYAGSINKSYTVRNLAPRDFNSLGNNTYEIATTDDLDRLAVLVNIAENNCSGLTFKQTANIAYAPTTAWNSGNENNFTAIGGYAKPFSGTYDGQDYTISGIRINNTTNNYQGLFGNLSDGTVKNVVLAETRITGYNYAGGIAGTNNRGNIEDCRVESNVSVNSCDETSNNYGGIAGSCEHGGTINRCTFSGEITVVTTLSNNSPSGQVGGIVGNLTSAAVSNCLVLGATISSQSQIGAIVGKNSGTITANYYHDCLVRNTKLQNESYTDVGVGSTSGNQDQEGARSVHALTLPDGVTATGESVDIDGVTHYASATTVTLACSNVPAGKKPVYSVGGNAIEGDTFVMPAADATVTVNLVAAWSGSGTADAPYIITTTAELDALAAAVKSGEAYSGTYFELGNDIAYSTTGLGDTDENFTTIGGYFNGSDKNFSGNFDGKGYTISGIRLYKNPGNSGNVNKNQAVFGRAVNATIKNVTIDDARITGYRIVAGLVGNCNGTTVENCLVLNSTITSGNTYVGAVIGQDNNGTYTANYYHACTVNGTADATNVGVGANGDVNASSDRAGVRSVHALNLPPGVTATGESVVINGPTYFAAGITVTLSYIGTPPQGTRFYHFTVDGEPIDGDTFTMPAHDTEVDVEYQSRYTFDSTTGTLSLNWGEFNKNDKWGNDATDWDVTSVTATDEVRFTGDCSFLFHGFSNCTSMDLSKVNTDSCTSMASMFDGCESLETLDLSSWNTANVTNMSSMFWKCSGLTALDLTGWNTAVVTDMAYMFYDCGNLETLDVSHFDTGNVTNMAYMFYDCGKLETLDVSHFDTGSVTNMSEVFMGCESLASLNLSGWNTANVTNMAYMFDGCHNLASLDVSHFDTGNVTNMSYMFGGCENLASLDVSHFDTGNVTDMSEMFSHCLNLGSLDLSGWNTGNVTDMTSVFKECSNLTTIYAGAGWSAENAASAGGGMFYNCTSLVGGMGTAYDAEHRNGDYARYDRGEAGHGYLTGVFTLTLPDDVTTTAVAALTHGDVNLYAGGDTITLSYGGELVEHRVVVFAVNGNAIGGDTFTMPFENVTVTVTVVDVPRYTFDSESGALALNWGAFNKDDKWGDDVTGWEVKSVTATDEVRFTGDCSGLFLGFENCESMDLSKVNTDSCTNMKEMFANCMNLTSLDLSGWNTGSVTNMSYMFDGCQNLASLDVTHFDTRNVTNMGGMFNGCRSLDSLDVTHFDTGNVTDMSDMFSGCESLDSLDVTHFDTRNVTNMGSMFQSCESLDSLDVTHFDTGNVTNMTRMFKSCESLASLDVTHFDTGNVTDMTCMFTFCTGLDSLDLSHFDTGNVTDMSSMFQSCESLASLDVTHFDTGNVTNMSYMFDGCYNLTSLDVSHFDTGSVTDMSEVFFECRNLTTLDLSGWNTGKVTDMYGMYGMFYNCTNLTTIYAGAGWSAENAASVGSEMFYKCTSLVGGKGTAFDAEHINGDYGRYDRGDAEPGYLTGVFTLTLAEDVTASPAATLTHGDVNLYAAGDTITLSYGGEVPEHQVAVFAVNGNAIEGDTFAMPFENVTVTVTVVDVPRYTFDSETGVLALNWGAFNKDDKWGDDVTNWKVKSVTATDEVRFTGDCSNMFYQLYNCESMDLSKVNTDSCTSMASMFYQCNQLDSLDLSSWNTASVTDMNNMFYGCQNLDSLNLSGWNTGNVTDMSRMFSACESLDSLDVTHFDTGNVTNMGSMFGMCQSLTSLDLSFFDTGNVTNMNGMFSSCTGFETLDLSFFDTGNVTSMNAMFYGCSSLVSLNLSGWDTGNVTNMGVMFYGCSSFETLDLSHFDTGNVTDMNSMFFGCTGLDSLDLSHFYTGNVTDMSCMFYNCSNLVSLDLSGWNTGNVTNMTCMFQNCSSLVSLDLSGWDTGNVTRMACLFLGCSSIKTLDLSGWNTGNVTDMTSVFEECSNLTTIYAGTGWSAENAASAGGGMFYNCTSLVGGMGTTYSPHHNHVNGDYARYDRGEDEPGYLTGVFTLTLPDDVTASPAATLTHGDVNLYAAGDTITLSYGGEVPEHQVAVFAVNGNAIEGDTFAMPFEDVTVTVTFGDAPRYTFDSETGVLALIWGAFNKDDKWGDDVTITDVTSVTATDEVRFTGDCSTLFQGFEDCKSMDLSKVNTDSCTNMSKMFYGLESLKTLNLSGWNTGNVTDMSFMFRGCEVLDTLDVSHFDTGSVTDMSDMFVSCGSQTSLDLSGWNTGSVTNMSEMFYGSEFKTLNLSGWNTANVTDMSGMFYACQNLESLDLSGWNTGNVTNMSEMFYICEELESLDVSGWNTGNVTDMSEMFTFCEGLESLDVSGWNTGNVTDMSYIFMGCTSLGSLDVSGWNTGNVTDMSGVFAACISLDSLDVTSFDTGNVTSMYGMFYQCSGLETLDLSHFDTGNVTDMNVMFTECTSLTTIYAGAGWNTENVIESSGMFLECTNLVGSMGTAYNEDHTDVEYARIDGGTESPGYLTGLFSITLPNDIEHGTLAATQGDKVLVNGDVVVTGSIVTLTVTPDKGYKLQSITVTIVSGEDEPSGAPMRLRGGTVEVTDGDEPNTYTFAMPAAPVAVNAVFKKSTPTDIDDINAAKPTNGQRYNLLGQPVGPDYKGIVIENGRKIYVE